MARTVLVADDSPTIQRRAKETLAAEGIEVVTVSNGVAAIKKLSTVKPSVVLADVSMPGKDGYEVCDFVKNAPELRHVPVLLVVSADEPYDEPRGSRAGADGRINKPFDRDELVSVVKRLLERAEAAAPRAPAPAPAAGPTSIPAPFPEPVDEPQEDYAKRGVALDALPEGVAFAEAGSEALPGPPPVPPEPSIPPYEAGVAAWPGESEEPPYPVEAAPPAEPAISEQDMPPSAASPESPEIPSEPVLVEEVAEDAPAPPSPPAAERTMLFRSPTQIAEPVMSDDLVPQPEPAAPPLAPPPPAQPLFAASTLESFSLTDAATGQVRFKGQEGEAAPDAAPPAVGPPPADTAAPPDTAASAAPAAPAPTLAPAVNPDLVHSIVHWVVAKMSPAAFSSEMIEQMSRRFADEIIAEMNADSSQHS